MKKIKILFASFFLVLSLCVQINSQTKWINGFSSRIAGENLDYHSCHPDANLALLVRCTDDKDYIEWNTDRVPPNYKDEYINFAWIAGYSVATSTSKHKFFLYVNDSLRFVFTTSPGQEKKSWQLNGTDGFKLKFKFIKVDQVDDFFGYMILTVPYKFLNGIDHAQIKIKGDASGSKDWYMTMQYPLIPKIRISPEKVVSKDSSGKLLQRVKVSIDHFDSPAEVKIYPDTGKPIISKLILGMNDFYINFTAPASPVESKIKIVMNGHSKTYTTIIKPARKITFYLIPHAHVDIGYSDLQTVVEKKHWNNYDKAIEYSKESAKYGHDAQFKWNVEVLWAVKSYLEHFPEKRAEFYDAVRKGWIGLDATYANTMTALSRPEELYRWVEYSNLLEKKIGVKIQSAMISDVPGYTWGTVQAFADNGIKYFSVGTNVFDRIGNALKTWGDKPFYWKSPSGKQKILIWLAGKGYSWFHQWRLTRDDFSPIAKYLDELDEEHYPYDMVHLRYNIGGDNGFPDSLLSKFVKNWNDTHVTPKFKIATNMEMFKDFEKKYGKVIPTYSGDFTPYWEDGAGSTARETAMNRNSAELLTQLESMYSLLDRADFPQKEFDDAWQYVLLFSEHTWGAWNSISDPDLESVKEQWKIKKSYGLKADSLAEDLLHRISDRESNKAVDKFYVFNPSSWQRSDIVIIPNSVNKTGSSIADENGNIIPSQILSGGDIAFTAQDIPAFGYKEFKLVNRTGYKALPSPLVDDQMSNKFYNLHFDRKTFALSGIYRKGEKYNYVDTSDNRDLNLFIHTGSNGADPTESSSPEVTEFENGPVLKSITIKSGARGCNSLAQQIILFNDLDKIEIKDIIDKKKDYNKENIRFMFPFNIKNPVSRINLAWAVIEPEKDQLKGANRNYFTVQHWIDVSNKQKGITLATVDAPLFEFGGMNAEAWMASPDKEWYTHTSSSALGYSWVMNNSWHTNFKASQKGIADFKYYLRPHNNFDYLSAYKFGIENSQPLRVIFSEKTIKNYSPIIKLDPSSSLVITIIEAARDGKSLIVRIFNPTKKTSESKLNWLGKGTPQIFLSNGDEEELHKIKDRVKLGPFEVQTLKIKES